jgi:hypothetical protein
MIQAQALFLRVSLITRSGTIFAQSDILDKAENVIFVDRVVIF